MSVSAAYRSPACSRKRTRAPRSNNLGWTEQRPRWLEGPRCSLAQSEGRTWCVPIPFVQSCLTLYAPTDCSLPDLSVYGILQVRILEWVAIPSSRGIFPTQGLTLSLLCLLHWQTGVLFCFLFFSFNHRIVVADIYRMNTIG